MSDEKDWRDDVPEEWLPDGLKPIAKAVGIAASIRLAEALGGLPLYLPKPDVVLARLRNRKIRAEFTGDNQDALALRYKITRRWVDEILKEQGVDDRQTAFSL